MSDGPLLPEREMLQRLVAIEERGKAQSETLENIRQDAQKVSSLIDAVSALERRHVSLEASVRAQWNKVDPIVHSDPPVTTRIRENERMLATLRSEVKTLTEHVDSMRDTGRRLVWTTVTFVVVGVLNALIQFSSTGGLP